MNDMRAWWEGPGGDEYMRRNATTPEDVHRRAIALRRPFSRLDPQPETVLEVGCGPGATLAALRVVLPDAVLYAVEPNESARAMASTLVHDATVLDGHAEAIPAADRSIDLVLTAGCLIHVPPDRLPGAMAEIARVSRRYVAAIEYFAPECEPILYHGEYRIWRQDFGRLYVEAGLRHVAHDFFWKPGGDGFDNTVCWLLEKP